MTVMTEQNTIQREKETQRVALAEWAFALVQFFPLSLFATYAYWRGTPTGDRWVTAFELGAAAAILEFVICFSQPRVANRLVLAANLYLVVAGAAAFAHQSWLLNIYGVFQESGIFLFMFAVGIVTTFWSAAGYVGAEVSSASKTDIRRASIWLVSATVLALGASRVFRGDRTWAAVVPIIALAVAQRVLRYRVCAVKNSDAPKAVVQPL